MHQAEQTTPPGVEQQNADLLSRVKAELATAGIPEAEASRAAPYIMARLNSGEPLSPEAAAQASAMGLFQSRSRKMSSMSIPTGSMRRHQLPNL